MRKKWVGEWAKRQRPFLSFVLLFLVAWELLSGAGIVNPALFSSPSRILGVLFGVGLTSQGALVKHTAASLMRLFASLPIAFVVAVALGIAMGKLKWLYDSLDPIITSLMPIPGIAWAPLFIMWVGLGDANIIMVGALAAFFPIVQNISAGIRAIDKNLVDSARIMGAGEIKMASLAFFASLPYLLTGLKLAIARSWRTIIAVEMIAASRSGLGYFILDASDMLHMGDVYAGIVILAICYFVMESIVISAERMTIERWGVANGKNI